METWVFVVLIILLFLYFFWQPKTDVQSMFETAPNNQQAIPPDVIQVIIEAVQKLHPDEVPLETLFINKNGEDKYNARFMFTNTQGFFATQYDVSAQVASEGTVSILNISSTAQVDNYDSGFTPYKADTYTDYTDISKFKESKLQSELTNYRQSAQKRIDTQWLSNESALKAYNQNINADQDLAKFMATAPPTNFTPGQPNPSTYVPGPSPARAGDMVASGARVFNAA